MYLCNYAKYLKWILQFETVTYEIQGNSRFLGRNGVLKYTALFENYFMTGRFHRPILYRFFIAISCL